MTESNHFAAEWRSVLERVHGFASERGAHLAATVVLLPYAQLMSEAQRQWQRLYPQGFAPRFETTRNWARVLGADAPEVGEFTGDVALDALTARDLLTRAGLKEYAGALTPVLLEMASQLATAAAAVSPAKRPAWAQSARALLHGAGEAQEGGAGEGGVLRFEVAAARIALEWVLASRYASDVLFTSGVRTSVDVLMVLDGLQPDPLAHALLAHWQEAGGVGASIAWPVAQKHAPGHIPGRIALHCADDAEDEAGRAAACVIDHLNAGRAPVALVAGDRALTRRIAALLEGAGVPVQDENGWTLSTTRAAARLMALLRACVWNAGADEVLDWLKHCAAASLLEQEGAVVTLNALPALEHWLRRHSLRQWRMAVAELVQQAERFPRKAALVAQTEEWRATMWAARPLVDWLLGLRTLLHDCGLWQPLLRDDAGQRVLTVLRLHEGMEVDLPRHDSSLSRLSLADFTHWVGRVLEAARFRPVWRSGASVTILPLAQLLARPFAALVLPGCDEKRLQAASEPPGLWTAAQREVLGLPMREQLAAALCAAWQHALRTPQVDILWRLGDEGGEPLLASPLVLALQIDGMDAGVVELGVDARTCRTVLPVPVSRPAPVGAQLPVKKLSSSAYADLRHCPYRFFALRQLRLQKSDEMGDEMDKRDFGIWLHAALQHFHEALRDAVPTGPQADRVAMMDAASAYAVRIQRLQEEAFLPFSSGWPVLRDGYLNWLAQHEAAGAVFCQAEVQASQPLELAAAESGAFLGVFPRTLDLTGTLDRVDSVDGVPLVIDYKTETDASTKKRIQAGGEDTQLAFYAALLPDNTLRAAYVNVGERGTTQLHEQPDVLALRGQLLAGIRDDMTRIAQGAPLPALGEGAVCDWCEARGLCRKDFW